MTKEEFLRTHWDDLNTKEKAKLLWKCPQLKEETVDLVAKSGSTALLRVVLKNQSFVLNSEQIAIALENEPDDKPLSVLQLLHGDAKIDWNHPKVLSYMVIKFSDSWAWAKTKIDSSSAMSLAPFEIMSTIFSSERSDDSLEFNLDSLHFLISQRDENVSKMAMDIWFARNAELRMKNQSYFLYEAMTRDILNSSGSNKPYFLKKIRESNGSTVRIDKRQYFELLNDKNPVVRMEAFHLMAGEDKTIKEVVRPLDVIAKEEYPWVWRGYFWAGLKPLTVPEVTTILRKPLNQETLEAYLKLLLIEQATPLEEFNRAAVGASGISSFRQLLDGLKPKIYEEALATKSDGDFINAAVTIRFSLKAALPSQFNERLVRLFDAKEGVFNVKGGHLICGFEKWHKPRFDEERRVLIAEMPKVKALYEAEYLKSLSGVSLNKTKRVL